MRKKTENSLARELSPKMQKFCLSIVEGDGPSEAYKGLTQPRHEQTASRSRHLCLLRDPRVRARIEELRTSLQRSRCLRATPLREIYEARGCQDQR
jgi:hypothetical protein